MTSVTEPVSLKYSWNMCSGILPNPNCLQNEDHQSEVVKVQFRLFDQHIPNTELFTNASNLWTVEILKLPFMHRWEFMSLEYRIWFLIVVCFLGIFNLHFENCNIQEIFSSQKSCWGVTWMMKTMNVTYQDLVIHFYHQDLLMVFHIPWIMSNKIKKLDAWPGNLLWSKDLQVWVRFLFTV